MSNNLYVLKFAVSTSTFTESYATVFCERCADLSVIETINHGIKQQYNNICTEKY